MNTYQKSKRLVSVFALVLSPACIVTDDTGHGLGSAGGNEAGQSAGLSPEEAADDLCERFDQCNLLDGVSIGECSQNINECVDTTFNQSQALS